MTRMIATLLAACSLAAAGAASAETSARIHHGDLDLNTSAGARAFAARVDSTAREFCRASNAQATKLAQRSSCERAVRAEAVQQLSANGRVRYAINAL